MVYLTESKMFLQIWELIAIIPKIHSIVGFVDQISHLHSAQMEVSIFSTVLNNKRYVCECDIRRIVGKRRHPKRN